MVLGGSRGIIPSDNIRYWRPWFCLQLLSIRGIFCFPFPKFLGCIVVFIIIFTIILLSKHPLSKDKPLQVHCSYNIPLVISIMLSSLFGHNQYLHKIDHLGPFGVDCKITRRRDHGALNLIQPLHTIAYIWRWDQRFVAFTFTSWLFHSYFLNDIKVSQ